MNRYTLFLIVLFIFAPSVMRTQGQTDAASSTSKNTGALSISVTSLDIKDEVLYLTYEIRNDSEDDAWIFAGWHILSQVTYGMNASIQIGEDGQTITIRARSKMKRTGTPPKPVYSRLVRLRSGDSQAESIFMAIPTCTGFKSEHVGQQEQATQYATRLAIELGYYQGNFPERIRKKLKPPENVFPEDPGNPPLSPQTFSGENEDLNSRDDELLVLEGLQEIESEEEQIIRTVIENIRIPYEETRNYTRKIKSPGLHSYEKIEIQYKPSMLEYFFPYKSQQSLLSPDEMEYLQSDKTIVLNDKQDIHTVAHFIPHTRADTTVVVGRLRYRSHADVVCYSESKPFLSFSICNDDIIVIERRYVIGFEGFPSLKKLTPQIQAIDLRMHCAANLKNQWYRLRIHNLLEALCQNDPSIRNKTLYPRPSEWCDDMLRPYPVLGGRGVGRWGTESHICLSAGEGKNHYAMNPNCKPNSPPDMVLLFETRAGWNQHGGPELFTFDNHDPKGGCVLLNDGTVKFIRTKEQLQQLRWK